MFKVILFLSVVVCAVLARPSKRLEENPIIETEYGSILGATFTNTLIGNEYYTFLGIPYAAPPVGALRFKAPIPHPGWSGLRDATVHGPTCHNEPGFFAMGEVESEDCLFLNVYTKDLDSSLPVMVFIHGGAYTSGSGDAIVYGPAHFMEEDVIIVTINYRLGTLGFLNTNDDNAQGNAGMKDQVQALRWIQKNIDKFGGDPARVTIFGESAGAASVHYLILSPLAAGLFQNAICQSGSVLSPWAFQPKPVEKAYELAANLGLEVTTTTELVDALMKLDPVAIIAADPGGFLMGAFSFVPSIEKSEGEEVFLSEHPLTVLESGNFNHVAFMNGFNDNEALMFVSPGEVGQQEIDWVNANRHHMIPPEWNIERDSAAEEDIINTLWEFYLNNEEITLAHRGNLSEFATDQQFVFPIDMSVRFHAEAQEEPVYYYTFSFDGDLNLIKLLVGMSEFPGAAHSDELLYMWDISRLIPVVVPDGNPAGPMRDTMVRLWTNFAKYSNPTYALDDLVTANWAPVAGNQEFMELNLPLEAGTHTFADRVALWQGLYDQYVQPNRPVKSV